MAEKKKGQKADFAKDKGAFHEGGSAKGAGTSQRGQQKKSGTPVSYTHLTLPTNSRV